MSGLDVLDLFSAAAGGWSLGMHRAGFRTVAACEAVEWRRALYAENNPGVVIYDDVRTLTADRLVRDLGRFPPIVVGSPPCQDISSANTKGKGVEGERSGLFFEAVRIIGEGRPRWFALENSANLRTRGADAVLSALEALGYACEAIVVGAGDVGANHERKRSWIIGFDPDEVADAGRREQRLQCRRGGGAGRTRAPFDGYDDTAEHGDADCQCGAAGFRAPALVGERTGSARCLGPDAVCRRDGPSSDEYAARLGHEGGRAWRHGADGLSAPSAASGSRNAPYTDQARRDARPEAGERNDLGAPAGTASVGASCDGADAHGEGQSHGAQHAEMGGRAGAGGDPVEPWADWNGGLAGHLRVDDGLSAWVAQQRVAVGGPRGTSAAALIVEAFGDAVVPQIPEAIGRSILRTEAALAALYGAAA